MILANACSLKILGVLASSKFPMLLANYHILHILGCWSCLEEFRAQKKRHFQSPLFLFMRKTAKV